MTNAVAEDPGERRFQGRTCTVTVKGGIATVEAKPGMESEALLEKRQVLLSSLRALHLPAGTIIPITQLIKMPGETERYSLQYEFVEGRRLSDFLLNANEEDSAPIARNLAEFMAWLHGMPFESQKGLSERAGLSMIEAYSEFSNGAELTVLFNDVHGNNLIVTDDGKIALLDVNDMCIGDPAAEFRKLFTLPGTAGKFSEIVLETYVERRAFPAEEAKRFRERVELYASAYQERHPEKTIKI